MHNLNTVRKQPVRVVGTNIYIGPLSCFAVCGKILLKITTYFILPLFKKLLYQYFVWHWFYLTNRSSINLEIAQNYTNSNRNPAQ